MITDKELLKLVKYKLGIFDLSQNPPEGALENVRDITIRNHSLSGKPLNIDLSELSELSRLEDLDIAKFAIDEIEARAIESLEALKRLTIRDSMISDSINPSALEMLTIERSRIDPKAMLPNAEVVSLIELDDVDLSKINHEESKIKSLLIRGGNVHNIEVLRELPNLTSLIIEGTTVNRGVLDELSKKGIFVKYDESKSRIDLAKTF